MEFMTKNEIYYNNKKLIGREKRGLPYNQWIYILENNIEILGANFNRKTKIQIRCNGNKNIYESNFKESLFKKEWYSQSFQSSAERNGMFGKKHTHKTKQKFKKRKPSNGFKGKKHSVESKSKISIAVSGEHNQFYNKKHSQQVREQISVNRKGKCLGKNNYFYGKKHSKKTIEQITFKGNKWRKENPELSYEAGLKGWQNSIFSKVKYGRKTSIERKVENKLKELKITDFNFSQILNRKYQYDFRIGKNILLEVHGDYWHGNPRKYGDSNGLKTLNEQQHNKIQQDIIKEKYAKDHGWKLFVIWEDDINNENWEVLKEIVKEIEHEI
jgi:very-short-patch-repair endonuclease